jgi:hypothetical protein
MENFALKAVDEVAIVAVGDNGIIPAPANFVLRHGFH